MENLIDRSLQYAVVGASNNTEKYGYKVLKDLADAGYHVTPVHPKEEKIYDRDVVHSVSELKNVDVLILVVPPAISLQVLKEAKDTGINKIWFQPGSSDDLTQEFCEENGMTYVDNMCIMIQKEK